MINYFFLLGVRGISNSVMFFFMGGCCVFSLATEAFFRFSTSCLIFIFFSFGGYIRWPSDSFSIFVPDVYCSPDWFRFMALVFSLLLSTSILEPSGDDS